MDSPIEQDPMYSEQEQQQSQHHEHQNGYPAIYGRPQPNVPLNEISIRTWELNENSTHYDMLIAAPSDQDLVKFWTGWSTIMFLTALLLTLILIPLITSAKIRKNPFHVYLIFLMFPDLLVAYICGTTCLTNALAGKFTSVFMCKFQSFYMIAYIGANGWLNACIARQLYQMLEAAKHFRRYSPPTHRRVLTEVALVYLYGMGLGLMGVLDAEWWPHKTRLTIGSACIPMDYSTASTIFFYCLMFPLLFGGPFGYVMYAGYQIHHQQLLPPTGRRRILAIYFFRLSVVFVVMWLPGLLFLFVAGAWLDPWVAWAGGSWSHLQGAVSALVSLLKPDIWETVLDFWTCNHFQQNRAKHGRPGASSNTHGGSTEEESKSFGLSMFKWKGNFSSRGFSIRSFQQSGPLNTTQQNNIDPNNSSNNNKGNTSTLSSGVDHPFDIDTGATKDERSQAMALSVLGGDDDDDSCAPPPEPETDEEGQRNAASLRFQMVDVVEGEDGEETERQPMDADVAAIFVKEGAAAMDSATDSNANTTH